MKYFKKFLIVGLFALFGVSFCSAGSVTYTGTVDLSIGNFYSNNALFYFSVPYTKSFEFNNTSTLDYDCVISNVNQDSMGSYNVSLRAYYADPNNSYNTLRNAVVVSFNMSPYSEYYDSNTNTYRFAGTVLTGKTLAFLFSSSDNYDLFQFNYSCTLSGTDVLGQVSCPSCPSQYTSQECQSEYSLIPISEVTKNYCEINFDMIDPVDCPISEGTGSVNRSALYVNNIQYQGADNIYVDINDILSYSMTYSSGNAVIEVEGYEVDEDYIEDIIKVQEFHPDNDDFKLAFIGGLTLILPYVVVVLFVIFVWKLIRKIFKS